MERLPQTQETSNGFMGRLKQAVDFVREQRRLHEQGKMRIADGLAHMDELTPEAVEMGADVQIRRKIII